MPLDTAQGGFGVFFFFAHLVKNLQLIISPMDGAVAREQGIFQFCYLWKSTSHMTIYFQTLCRV